jgi:paraquat-inducible protein B
MEGVDLKGVTDQWKKTGAQVEALAGAPEIRQTFASLNAAATDLRGVLAKLDAQVGPAGKEFTETLAQAEARRGLAERRRDDGRKFIATHNGLGDEVVGTLQQLSEAADAVKRLAGFSSAIPTRC